MDFGWGAGPLSPAGASTDPLNLLGDNLLIDLDDKTLQCLMGGPTAGFAACMSGGGGFTSSALNGGGGAGETASGIGKREREEEIAAADDDGDDDSEGAGDDRSGGGAGGRARKKGKKAAADSANVVKACREKARREKLNECFEELARLCDPSGKMTRTDRISIVQDAIRAMGGLRVENNQLRQLNKFLEERVRHLETARAQGMYQQAMMQQMAMQQPQQQQPHQQQAHPDPAAAAAVTVTAGQSEIQPAGSNGVPEAAAAAVAAAAAAVGGPIQQQQAMAAAQQQQAMQQQQQQQAAMQQQQQSGLLPPGMMLMPITAAAVAAAPAAYGHQSYFSIKADTFDTGMAGSSAASMGLPAGGSGSFMMASMPHSQAPATAAMQQQAAALPQVMPANAPAMSWLPAPDISQDQKLRPPAA